MAAYRLFVCTIWAHPGRDLRHVPGPSWPESPAQCQLGRRAGAIIRWQIGFPGSRKQKLCKARPAILVL